MEKFNKGGILPHPEASEASDNMLLKETPQEVHSVIYKSINSEMVKDTIKRTRAAAGPSEVDADGWRRILILGNFGNVGEDFQWQKEGGVKKKVQIILLPS